MRIIFDLLPWEPIFLGSSFGLIGTAAINGIRLVRGRALGPWRWSVLALCGVGAALPWLAVPGFGARLQRGLQTNIAETQPDATLPELLPRRYLLSLSSTADASAAACVQLGWRIVERGDALIAAEVPVPGGLFIDDLRITLSADGPVTVVNIHSSSRVGQGDLGENRRHVVQFFAALEQTLGG